MFINIKIQSKLTQLTVWASLRLV